MSFKNTLHIAAHDSPFRLVVEPWADEFTISGGEEFTLVAIHPTVVPTFTVTVCRASDLMVYVNESGATYEFWRGETREFHITVPIPDFPLNTGDSNFWESPEDNEDWNNA
jgi:hypothetical protein